MRAARWMSSGLPRGCWLAGCRLRGRRAVPTGGVLVVDQGGRAAVVCRDLSLGTLGFTEGAQRLARALTSAVRGRMAAHKELSADLSGGLDSFTVAALAAAARPDLALPTITLTCADAVGANLGNDDPAHARMVAAAVPGIEHVELPLPVAVEPYSGLADMPHTDEPFEDVSIFARLR
jgi:asparagine synthase (glutamine-hydrolysing)